jgi:resuscitation-promoting factor RpfA
VVAAALAVRPGSRLLRAWTSTLAPRLVRAVASRAAGVALLAGTLAPSVAVAAPHPGPTTAGPLAPPALLPVEAPTDAAAPTATAPVPPVATDAVPAPRVAAPDVPRTEDDAAATAPTGTPERPPASPATPPSVTSRRETPPQDATTVTVAPGDHLWALTARALAAARGVAVDQLDPAEVVGPWRATVERNRGHLRSGDPDVIHPGEVVVLATDPTHPPQEERP